MSMRVIMDLKPQNTGFELSASGKSARLLCEFSGRYKSENTVEVELMVTKQTSFGRPLDVLSQELSGIIASGSLLRVSGQLERLAYQEREGGREVDKLRLIAHQVDESYEIEPLFSVAAIQGNVGLPLNAAFFKEEGGKCTSHFILAAEPESGYDKEAYLTVFVSAFGETARQIKQMNLKEKSYVMATGRLEAGNSPGLLMLKLGCVRYAKFPPKKEKR